MLAYKKQDDPRIVVGLGPPSMPKRGSSWRGLAALAKRDFHLLGQVSPREQGLSFGTRVVWRTTKTRGWAWTLEALPECLQMKRSRGRTSPGLRTACSAASEDTHMTRLACARICHLIP